MDKKILVVDNHPMVLKLITNLLEKDGYEVRAAGDGLSALDIRMQGLNGYDILQKVKRLDPDLFIIVVTAIDVPNMEEMLEHSGAHALLAQAH